MGRGATSLKMRRRVAQAKKKAILKAKKAGQ
jgi:hypothetical protein